MMPTAHAATVNFLNRNDGAINILVYRRRIHENSFTVIRNFFLDSCKIGYVPSKKKFERMQATRFFLGLSIHCKIESKLLLVTDNHAVRAEQPSSRICF